MDNIQKCECIVGMKYDYENTELLTLAELKEHIEETKAFAENGIFEIKVYTLADYADKRKNTDLHRFEYCPHCGKKIDWKAIKGDSVELKDDKTNTLLVAKLERVEECG